MIIHLYQSYDNISNEEKITEIKRLINEKDCFKCLAIEYCYYIEYDLKLSQEDYHIFSILLGNVNQKSSFDEFAIANDFLKVEIGPRLNFSSAFSTNAISIFNSINMSHIKRIERSKRYLILADFKYHETIKINLYDKMTECCYEKPLTSFNLISSIEDIYEIDVIQKKELALEEVGHKLGLSFDKWDLEFYVNMFVHIFKRNPTNVECFDLAQSNSEHSRHWYFKGEFIIDNQKMSKSLLKRIMDTQLYSNNNNVIKFSDNSSAIKGFNIKTLNPNSVYKSSPLVEKCDILRHIVFTAETHNFPTAVAPFPGATTGTGGRIRDVQATGKGANVIAGTVGYCFGNLNIPGYDLPMDNPNFDYPSNFATPLKIIIEASNGASDYGNKFGEPVLCGFARSFGMLVGDAGRREWIKPIMFTAGIGSIDNLHLIKDAPQPEMEVVKIGGPVLRIGMGGGSASSVCVQGSQQVGLDFDAVQRGDAEMEQRMNRVVRACIELGKFNPICSIHDQGAGGNGNVLKELCYPEGALIHLSKFQLGDPTLSALEVWGAEYQESNALLCKSSDVPLLQSIALREKCPISFVGKITEDGHIRFIDDRNSDHMNKLLPVNLKLETILGDMPQKVYNVKRIKEKESKFELPANVNLFEALSQVLKLPAVSSKRYLTNKVDRSVTGLVAQQQCVGPLHTPLADVAVVALSHLNTVGAATAIGEQPIKMLVDVACGARVAVGEALTNLVFASITCLKDVKCSGNWMWPAKHPGEDAKLYDACVAMCDVMQGLGIAVDGGKDSLSMAALLPDGQVVKAPGSLVISAYAPCTDITLTVTPDLKCNNSSNGVLLWVKMSKGNGRLGGSALAQSFGVLGNESPDLDDAFLFSSGFNVTQLLIRDRMILSGHDVSDGGFITCLLEMAFAGNCGASISIQSVNQESIYELLFGEELGLVLEVSDKNKLLVMQAFAESGVECLQVGFSQPTPHIQIKINDKVVLSESMVMLRSIWEETSFQLERLQCNVDCVKQEEELMKTRTGPNFSLTFDPQEFVLNLPKNIQNQPRVAIMREEGSNGDREMAAAFHMAGFEVWDVCMQDFHLDNTFSLDAFRGLAFVGGFSYADVFGSANGWATVIRLNARISTEFRKFYERTDTFSLGVCNGCQLMARLGWVASEEVNVQFEKNMSGRFESRFVSVRINESPAIMLKGMHSSVLGVWVAHGEGQVKFENDDGLSKATSNGQIAISYVDDAGLATTAYPMNPNGSPLGIAGLCSLDGRHLALMPHPERGVCMWQWPWMPGQWRDKVTVSPWACIFNNAYRWCLKST